MIINKDGLITENQNTNDTIELKANETINSTNDNLDFNSNTNVNEVQENSQGTVLASDVPFFEDPSDTSTNNHISISEVQLSLELDFSVAEIADQKETAETNCLALTVRKNYNLSIIKNGLLTTLRVSWKVGISTLLLNILKLFF